MNDAVLSSFRQIADNMAGPEPRNWEWIGPHMSQRMFGITESRATAYAERHGGVARKMEGEDRPVVGTVPTAIEHHRTIQQIARDALDRCGETDVLSFLVAAHNEAMDNGDEYAAERYAEAHEMLLYEGGV